MKITVHSTRGPRWFTFSEDSSIAEVVKEVVTAFDFPPTHHYGMLLSCNTSTPLRSDRTLRSYDIRDGSTLFLTITGCGATVSDCAGIIHMDSEQCDSHAES